MEKWRRLYKQSDVGKLRLFFKTSDHALKWQSVLSINPWNKMLQVTKKVIKQKKRNKELRKHHHTKTSICQVLNLTVIFLKTPKNFNSIQLNAQVNCLISEYIKS